jgi:hypothetical protein
MGGNVVVADAQHVAGFGLGAAAVTILANGAIQSIELGNLHAPILRKGHIR